MCVVSMIFDRYPSIEPERWMTPGTLTIDPFKLTKITPIGMTVTVTKTALDLLEELIAKAKELDGALGLTDCEDPKKGEWLEAILNRLGKQKSRRLMIG